MRTRPDGSLWRAVDETLERPVLVQAYALSHPYGGEIVDAARRAALVEDPRLQRVLAAGEERGTPYVVLERVPGRSLAELLQNGPLPAETARRIAGEASQALDRAAARGLHHLRLRPTSVVVAPDGGVTVAGTAIDAAADGIESPSMDAAARSDAVGLVALLYATLTGRWPGTHDAGLARAPRVAGRPVPPGDLVAGVPNDLDTLCSVVLGPHDDGPRSPGDLAAQLAPWAAAAPLTDPRGLHLGAPARPGSGYSPPARPPTPGRPSQPAAGRPPTAGRPRRTAPVPEASAAPVPAADALAAGAPDAVGSGAAGAVAAGAVAAGAVAAGAGAAGADAAATDAAKQTNGASASTGRPGWATVDDLRRALRGAARGMGRDTGTGIPLAATPPPAGAPLADAPSPIGPPVEQPVTAPVPAVTPESPRRAAQAAARSRGHAATSTPAAGPAAPPSQPEATAPSGAAAAASAAAAAAPAPAEPPRERVPERTPERTADQAPEPGRVRDRAAEPVLDRTTDGTTDRATDRAATPSARPATPTPAAASAPPPTRAAAVPASAPRSRAESPAWGGAPPSHPYASSWEDAPTGGIDALDILGSVAHPEEPPVPFGPPAPLTRPPREQSRLVVLVLAILLIVFGVFAVTRFVDFHPAPLINKGGGAPVPSGAGASSAAPAPSAAPAASPSAGAATASSSPVSIAGAQALDPQGDDAENNDLVSRAIDGDPKTSWHSDHYSSPDFGGLKKGLGLAVDLGETSTVTSVTVTAPGTDGTLELRTADGPDVAGSVVVATGRLTGSGTVVLTPSKPVSTRELVVWFTRLPDSGDGRRAVVAEIDVR